MLSSTSGQGKSFNSTTKQPDSNTKRNNNSYNNNKGMISSSSSSSKSSSTASSSSSPSPFSPSHNNNNNNNNNNFHHHHHQQQAAAAAPKAKTMEEVWRDISLASLHDHPCEEQDLSSSTPLTIHNPPPPPPPHHNPNFILQDFLAQPFCKDPPPRIVSGGGGGRCDCTTTTTTTTATATATTTTTGLYGSPAPPAPATALSLNTGPGFDFVHISDPLRTSSHLQSHYPVSNISSFNSPFDALGSSPGLPSFGRKRVQDSDISSGDRRQKRMIKNRESAARSRARKQAYTNELELEVTHLLEENARLRRQQEELYMAAAIQLPKKHTLHRTSTAPF